MTDQFLQLASLTLNDIKGLLEQQNEYWKLWKEEKDEYNKSKEASKRRNERFMKTLQSIAPIIVAELMKAKMQEDLDSQPGPTVTAESPFGSIPKTAKKRKFKSRFR